MSGIIRIMATSGNNVHAPDYHAEITAEKIISSAETAVISVGDTAHPEIVSAGRELRKAIEKLLLPHHQKIHDHEQGQLAEHGLDRLEQPLETKDLVDGQLLEDIVAAARSTPLAALFQRDDVRAAILAELHHEARSQMNVHRLVFQQADRLAKRPRVVN